MDTIETAKPLADGTRLRGVWGAGIPETEALIVGTAGIVRGVIQ